MSDIFHADLFTPNEDGFTHADWDALFVRCENDCDKTVAAFLNYRSHHSAERIHLRYDQSRQDHRLPYTVVELCARVIGYTPDPTDGEFVWTKKEGG